MIKTFSPTATGGNLYIFRNAGDFNYIRNLADADSVSVGGYQIMSVGANNDEGIRRAAIGFDTSILRSIVKVNSLKLRVSCTPSNTSGSPAIHVVATSWNPASNIVVGDYDSLTYSSLGNVAWGTFVNTDITLSTSLLNKTGYTKFFLITAYDLNNQEPGGNDIADISASLVVDYVPAIRRGSFI